MNPKIVTITPLMIKTDPDLMSTFGRNEYEKIAKSIISFCQTLGDWAPFSQDQIWRIYLKKNPNEKQFMFDMDFRGLVDLGVLIDQGNGMFLVSDFFVLRCFVSDHTEECLYSKQTSA